jgi:hypothetical protein
MVAEVRDALLRHHPDWAGQEWIAPGVGCFCAEHGPGWLR